MNIVKSKNIKKPIISLKILKDKSLAVVDSGSIVRYLNLETLDMMSGFKANITHLRYKTTVFELSSDGKYFATLTADAKESLLCDAKTKKLITKVNRHQGDVSCVGIDPRGEYMFSCGDDGKTFAYDTKSGNLVFTLPTHADTINSIAFSKNVNWIATAGYDKKISLFNLVTMTPKVKLVSHAAPITNIIFFHKTKLLSVDKNSVGIVWNITTGKIIERLQGIHDDVLKITISTDEKFLFLGTALGYILLYDLHTYQQLSTKYIKMDSSITAMTFDDTKNHLIIGTEDGFLASYDIYEGLNTLKELLMKKEFNAMAALTQNNPVLAYTEIYNLVINLWEKTLEKAKIALENGDKNKAILLFGHFKNIPSKNRIIQQVIKEFEEFDKFKLYIEQGKLALAYSLVNKHPNYKETKLYKGLEARWKSAFAQAQKYALQIRGTEKAKELLAPYRGISEKTKLIQELLTQGEVYKRFCISIAQEEYKIGFELIKRHPFLEEFPEYDALINFGDSLYFKVQQLIKEGDTHTALRILNILVNFPDFSEEVKTLSSEIDSKQKFIKAVEEEDNNTIYNLMTEMEDLQETEDGIRFQEEWSEALVQANKHAIKGDALELQKSLLKYMKISSKNSVMATVFSMCYLVQLENAMKEKHPQNEIENGIKNYMLNFGLQEQIENFFASFKEVYPSSELSLELLTQGSLTMWSPSMIRESILD